MSKFLNDQKNSFLTTNNLYKKIKKNHNSDTKTWTKRVKRPNFFKSEMRIQKNDLKILFKKRLFQNFFAFHFSTTKKNLQFEVQTCIYAYANFAAKLQQKKYAFFYSCSSSDHKVTYLYIYKKILVFFD